MRSSSSAARRMFAEASSNRSKNACSLGMKNRDRRPTWTGLLGGRKSERRAPRGVPAVVKIWRTLVVGQAERVDDRPTEHDDRQHVEPNQHDRDEREGGPEV